MAEVRVERLTKRYGSATAVDELDLTVRDGEFLTLLGPSGCGKTTTLRCIAGLEEPDAGTVSIGGRVMSASERKLFVRPERRDIGMVFQSYALWPHMTVSANVAYPLKLRRVPSAERDRRVGEMLELVGLAEFAGRSATSLSGGQQQRVAVARALVSAPRVLLFDEPLSNLDTRLRATMGAELRAIHARTGTTSICVTHDQTEALTLSDRVVVMRDGRVEQAGTPEEIFVTPRTRFVAHFVGFDAALPGRVVELDGGMAYVRIDGTDRVVRCRPGSDLPLDAAVDLMLRSSAVSVQPAEHDDGALNRVPGVVVDRAFQGETVQFTLDVAGHRLLAQVPSHATGGQAEAGRIDEGPVEVVLPEAGAFAFLAEHRAHAAERPAAPVGPTGLPLPADDLGLPTTLGGDPR